MPQQPPMESNIFLFLKEKNTKITIGDFFVLFQYFFVLFFIQNVLFYLLLCYFFILFYSSFFRIPSKTFTQIEIIPKKNECDSLINLSTLNENYKEKNIDIFIYFSMITKKKRKISMKLLKMMILKK